MKRIKRKGSQCLNCGERFYKDVNYCPHCGQENTDNYVSLKTLLGDFFNNYFSFDSRFIRTFSPFLFRPGKVTQAFLDGKRLLFANPIRWYLVISLFHFLMLNQFERIDTNDKKSKNSIVDFNSDGVDLSSQQLDSMHTLPDSIKYNFEDEDNLEISSYEYAVIEAMARADTFSTDEIYDSLKIDQKPFFTKIVSTLIIKSVNSSTGTMNNYILDQVPMIVFFILPLYALLLKAFYFKKGFYIKHLIHSLHIHSFLFLVLGIGWMISWVVTDVAELFAILGFLLTFIYILFSSKRLYKQSYLVLFIKTSSIGLLYLLVVAITFILGILISVLLM